VIKEMVGPIMFQGFTVREKYAAENREAVKVFFTRYYETVKKMQSDPSMFVKVLGSWDVSEAVAKQLAEVELPTYSTDGTLTEEAIKNSGEYASFLLGRPVEAKFTHWQALVAK
jgi:hypothetical protein